MIGAVDMLDHVHRLSRKYGKNFDTERTRNEATEFAAVLAPYHQDDVAAGVSLHIRRKPHYPTPQELADAAQEVQRGRPRRARSTSVIEGEYICPDCGTIEQERAWPISRKTMFKGDAVAVGRHLTDERPPWHGGLPSGEPGELLTARRVLCDCEYARTIQYRTVDELTQMDPDDPFVRNEHQRRARERRG